MPLTREQFDELRKKGLSLEQIVSFEQGKKPEDIAFERKKENEGFFKSTFRGLVTPVVSTLARPIQATAGLLGADLDKIDKKTKEILPYFGGDLRTPRTGRDVLRDVGRGAQTVAFGIGGGGGAKAIQTGLRGAVKQGAVEGAKVGLKSGALGGFGLSLEDAEASPSSVAFQTLFGAGAGLVLGAGLGATTPIVVKGVNATRKLTNLGEIEKKLYQSNKEAFKPTPSQLNDWSYKKVDPIETFTQEFGPEGLPRNKSGQLILDDFIAQTDARYKAGSEGFNTILRNSPEVTSLSKMEKKAIEATQKSSLTPSQKQTAISKIQNEYLAIREELKANGQLLGDDNVAVSVADNYKDRFWGATRNFGSEESTVTNAVNRNIGHSFKEGIEEVVTDVNVRQYNKKLQQLIELRDFLESRNGKISGTGGKMTRLIGRVVGSVAGSGGGVGGSIAGSITGDQIARALTSPSARTWVLRKQLAKLSPGERASLEKQAMEIIAKMRQKRMETLALPAGNPSISNINQGRAIPVLPNKPGLEYVGGETSIGNYSPRVLSNQPPTTNPTITTNKNAIPESKQSISPKSSKLSDREKLISSLSPSQKESFSKGNPKEQSEALKQLRLKSDMNKNPEKYGIQSSNTPKKLSPNISVVSAYGNNFLGFNMKSLEKMADEKGYPLYDQLLKVDAQVDVIDKIEVMQKIVDGLKKYSPYIRTITGDTVDVQKLSDLSYFKKAYESTFARGGSTDEKLYKIIKKELVPEGKEPSGYLAELYKKTRELPTETFAAAPLIVLPGTDKEKKPLTIKTSEVSSELKPVLFGEISNRSKEKKELEARVILSTAINRMKEYAKKGQPKTLSEVLAMPNQYQAYRGEQYTAYKEGNLDTLGNKKKQEVDEVIEKILKELRDGKFKDITKGAFYYIHNRDGSITYDDKRKLFK